MANIFVDPVIVMTPPDNTSRNGIEVWLTNLTIWLQEALTSPFEWLHFVQASDLLQESGRFPDFNLLKNWQKKYRLDINISQIARNVNTFFRNDEFDLKQNLDRLAYDFEVEAGSISISPILFTTRWHEAIHEDMHSLFVATCVSKCLHHDVARELRIATLAFPHPAREIDVSAIIVDAIPDFPRNADNMISQTFPLLFTPDDLLPLIDVIELWDKDNAKAWRLMLEKHGAGWRMHYWQIPTPEGSVVEFSNVVKESDDTICE